MSKVVYVTQFVPKLSYDKAKEFGEVVFLTQNDLAYDPSPDAFNKGLIKRIDYLLEKYNPGRDYILLSGSPAIILLVGTLLDNDVEHLVLRWDNRVYEYRLSTINLSQGIIANDTGRINSKIS